jgi:hypothetical protein
MLEFEVWMLEFQICEMGILKLRGFSNARQIDFVGQGGYNTSQCALQRTHEDMLRIPEWNSISGLVI